MSEAIEKPRSQSDEQTEENVSQPADSQEPAEAAEQSRGELAAPTEPLDISLTLGDILALAFATVAIAGALLIVFDPSLVPELSIVFTLLTLVGAVTLFLGGRIVYRQLADGSEQADPPLVEHRSTTTVPGEDIDANLHAGVGGGPLANFKEHKSVRGRLRQLVVTMLRHQGESVEKATDIIKAKSWTDDELATSFFTIATPLTRAERFKLRLQGKSVFALKARHVVDAVARNLEVPDRVWTNPEESGDMSAVTEGWRGTIDDLELADRRLDRWKVPTGVTLLALGTGVVVRAPGLLLAAAVGAGFVGYAYAGSAPTPKLAVVRELSVDDPDPGDSVTVTVTVENVGESMLFDLRLVDGVPGGLEVEDGTPRHGTVLSPGSTATFRYTLLADRGTHRFEEMAVIARDASGGVERTASVSVDGDDSLTCSPKPTSRMEIPVRSKTTRDVGRIVTDTGGSGIEFHSVREYRHGDPLKRVDWSRLARNEGLATLQFNVERSTTVVLLVDSRVEAFVAPDHDAPSAVERSLGAAAETFVGLLGSDDRVGLAGLGPGEPWLAPGAGHGHWVLAREMLASHDAFSAPEEDSGFYAPLALRRLRKRLPADAQLVFFSPLVDDMAVEIARRLHAYDYPMTVVSPQTTKTTSAGRTAAHVERRLRLSRLRRADVRVVDWEADEPLSGAIDRAQRRWSR